MFAFIGIGANDIQIPLMIHSTWQHAFDYLDMYLGIGEAKELVYTVTYHGSTEKINKIITNKLFKRRGGATVEEWIESLKSENRFISYKDYKYPENENFSISLEEIFDESRDNELLRAFFVDGSYYGGCGGCYSILVKKIEFGQPLVRWNLD
jgi:hypothetical protein